MNTYQFTYSDGTTSLAYGATASKAKYSKFLDVSDCLDVTFLQFMRMVKVRKVSAPDDAYQYINRAYSRSFEVGQHVVVEECGMSAEVQGIVVYPSTSKNYVNIQLEGTDYASLFHPSSVSDATQ